MSDICKCTLCGNTKTEKITVKNDSRFYYLCENCGLIFTAPEFLLSPEEEKSRYDMHENGPEFPGHVAFLEKILKPSMKYLNPSLKGLDYGCGANPVISVWLKERGISCENYDPLYGFQNNSTQYDFIFSTEVFEHFCDPFKEWDKITKLLKPGGYLLIMTSRWNEADGLESWHYIRDHTHVCFYNIKTFQYAAGFWGYNILEQDNKSIVILQRVP